MSDHHAYRGGALEHTVAVTMLAVALCDLHPALDKDVLVTAALVHELGTVAASAARRATPVKVPDRSLAHVLGASSARCELTAERRSLPRARPTESVRALRCRADRT